MRGVTGGPQAVEHERVEKEVHDVDWDLSQIEKGGFEHFMLKEIMEQPDAVRNAMRGRLDRLVIRTTLQGESG